MITPGNVEADYTRTMSLEAMQRDKDRPEPWTINTCVKYDGLRGDIQIKCLEFWKQEKANSCHEFPKNRDEARFG